MLTRIAVAVLATFLLAAADDAAAVVGYAPPVGGEVVDRWRPPSSRYGSGNRGIDLSTAPAETVRASADGTVVFAGRIGSASHVVVLHADGIRTSYSFLAEVAVRRGARVAQGDAVGTAAGATVHFGARAGDEYVDPTVLLGAGPPRVHLVPADLRDPLAEWRERRSLIDQLVGTGAAVIGAVGDLRLPAPRVPAFVRDRWRRFDEGVRAVGHALNVPHQRAARRRRIERVREDQRDCTPSTVVTPTRLPERRIAILVGGLGSSSGHAAVLRVDTDALGYRDGDVAQFSYAGGQSSGDRRLEGITVRDYGPAATWTDLEESGARLRELLVDVAAAHPGVPVDLIAHSQGGIVVRAALDGADTWDPTMPVVANVVTLGSPHHGAVLATAGNVIGITPQGERFLEGVQRVSLGAAPAAERSTQQLASYSHLIDDLGDRSLPAGTRVTSIAATGDLTVDDQLSAIDHATNVAVDLPLHHRTHDRLPGDARTHRELALALNGLGPACR